MKPDILVEYEATGQVLEAALAHLTDESDEAAHELYVRYWQQPNSTFARALLAQLSARYVVAYSQGGAATTEGLRLAGCLIGLTQDVRGSLLLCRTKQLTCSTACEFDIQLVAFAGVQQTIAYLQTLADPEAAQAVAYLQQCNGNCQTLPCLK